MRLIGELMWRLGKVLHGGEITSADVASLQGKLLFDRYPRRDRLVKFFILLSLSVIIATYGIIGNSAASVIGAMIVSPMMTPIMALSLSIVSGDARNILRSVLVIAAGLVTIVGLAFLLSSIMSLTAHIAGNPQVTERISPRLIDLAIALASGAAGAFAAGREDVSDALPGVAIAVSLMPPLAVVGICLAAGATGDALGALLLFLTNFLAIIIAGFIVFAIMGYGGAALDLKGKKAKDFSIVVIVVATIVISVPLGVTGFRATGEQLLKQRTEREVEEWLAGTGYELFSIEVSGREVDAIVSGEGDLPSFDDLLSNVRDSAGDVTIRLKVVPERTYEGSTFE